MAEKSVYLPWLICKYIDHELSIVFIWSDHALASSKNTCDITLKHVLFTELNLRQNAALKSLHISF